MPFFILGDEAYPLKTYLMKLFARKDLSCEERVFNYRLSLSRSCVECAFGILTAKWRLLNKAIGTKVNKAERIVSCICWLHNTINTITELEGTTYDHTVLQEQTSAVHHSFGPQSGNRRFKFFQSLLYRTYCSYTITELAGLFALSKPTSLSQTVGSCWETTF